MSVECTRCGVCCFSETERHVRVTGDDHERLGDAADDLVVFLGNQAFLRLVGTPGSRHCAALDLLPGGLFSCRVYEHRPQICRDLARSSPQCAGEITSKGPRLQLLRLP